MVSILIAAVTLALDIWTKFLVSSRMYELEEIEIIPGFFSLQYVMNPGAAFGLLANQRWLFIVVTFVALGGMLYVILKRPEAREGVVPLGLGLLLGGAAGNLVDRIRFGKVVDFLLFYWKDYHFPNFNVADIGITVGVSLLVLHLTLNGEREARESA